MLKGRIRSVDRTPLLLLVFAFFVLLIALAILGWMRRRRRQSTIDCPERVPSDLGEVIAQLEGFYVSTTLADDPLNRIAVHGLGFRARATVTVAERGVVIGLPGNDVFVPTTSIRHVTRAQYTIDRVVEAGGLALLAWRLGDVEVDSYFRVEETQYLVDAIASTLPVITGGKA
jgi:hypothetical protein